MHAPLAKADNMSVGNNILSRLVCYFALNPWFCWVQSWAVFQQYHRRESAVVSNIITGVMRLYKASLGTQCNFGVARLARSHGD